MRFPFRALIVLTAFVIPVPGLAQPVVPEFQVNTYTTSRQESAAVATDAAGNFVVVWQSLESAGDPSLASVQAQRYDATATPVGGEFQVNTYTTNGQGVPAVATDAAGNFVVVWTSYGSAGSDSSSNSVQAQRYDATGAPVGGEFQVNTYTTSSQVAPAVATDAAGNSVVAWTSNGSAGSDTSSNSVQAQRYDATGAPVGGEFQVNTYTTSSQAVPAVAADAAGNFVVAWRSNGSAGSDTSSYSVQARRYDATGAPLGGEFQVNTYTTTDQRDPAVATDAAGNFVVAWRSNGSTGSDNSGTSVQARRYDATGLPLGGEFQVNTYITSYQGVPAVATDAAGSFVVAWESAGSAGSDTSDYSVQAQHYDATGVPLGGELQLNIFTTSFQAAPAVATDAAGNFVVAWQSAASAGSDISNYSVQAQRYALTFTSTTSSSSTVPSTSVTSTSSTTSTTLAPTDLLPVKIGLIKPGTLAKLVAKPSTGDAFVLPTANPVVQGGALRLFDTSVTAGDDTYVLAAGASTWKGLGSPAGSKGWKYKGAGTVGDPCKVILIKTNVIKAVCKGAGITLQPPFLGEVGVILSLGASDRYCARLGGATVKNDDSLLKRKDAPAPAGCPDFTCGSVVTKWGTNGPADGQFVGPQDVAVDAGGNVYVADQGNVRVQKFTSAGAFVTKWGSSGVGDGQFATVDAVAVDASGNVYVADGGLNSRIQKFTSTGTFLTKWGSLGTGPGQFDAASGIAVDGVGDVYVADYANDRVQKFTSTGTFLATWGGLGSGNGQFDGPTRIAVDASNDIYVNDIGNSRVQKFTSGGTFLTAWGSNGSGDGQFDGVYGIAVDANGHVYVVDAYNRRIQKFDSTGTFLAKWGSLGGMDGQFGANPLGIAVDSTGAIYVADTAGDRIQKFVCP